MVPTAMEAGRDMDGFIVGGFADDNVRITETAHNFFVSI